jgi:hypothetical protein
VNTTFVIRIVAVLSLCCAVTSQAPWWDHPQRVGLGAGTVVKVRIQMETRAIPTSGSISIGSRVVDSSTPQQVGVEVGLVEFRDVISSTHKGRLLAAEREYITLKREYYERDARAGSPVDDSQDPAIKEQSKAVGSRVGFRWEGDASQPSVVSCSVDESPLRQALMRHARPSFLAPLIDPQSATGQEAQWKIPMEVLRDYVFLPGGDLFSSDINSLAVCLLAVKSR